MHRKVVTVVFCDVVGSTSLGDSLDPEALQDILAHYFERMKAIVESHGGTVEKFIGDAVMAVFGVPAAHEDDALRACRAAVEMREAFPELGVSGRIGVNTGEVVVGTEERLATGAAVNVAARLQQAAAPDEVLIGEATLELVRGAVDAEPVEPLELKGKAEPVPAHRLVSVRAAPERLHRARFVGRKRELALVQAGWEQARTEATCELVTVVGEAGVGESRLVSEALAQIDSRVIGGRCLPYGEGITYWPLVEVVKQLDALPDDPSAAASIRSLLGESDQATSAEEIAWAFRKLLEEQAPLVVVFDDVQWAEEAFLDLVEAAALLGRAGPLLLLCMARPELIERRPTWPGPIRLEPLADEEADELLEGAFDRDQRARIARAAGGNPLFITEMVAMANEEEGEVAVPATLRALLAARLDQLDPDERLVLERGAVEGEIFHRGAVQALSADGPVTSRLAALVRKGLIRPDNPQLPGEEAFRFHHLLLRDAAYEALPKATRADLHAHFADWLDDHGQALVERDEIVGYHLEQAGRYQAELGRPDPVLADRASARLAAAGRRAVDRQDFGPGAALLTRAAELVRPHRTDITLELESAWAHGEGDVRVAIPIAEAAGERAEAAGDRSGAMLARAMALLVRTFAGEPDPTDELVALCRAALPFEEERGDPRRLALLWETLGVAANFRSQNEDQVEASLQALRYQRLAGSSRSDPWLELALIAGPRPVEEAMRTIDEIAAWRPPGAQDFPRAILLAMRGRFGQAWPLAEARASHLREVTGTIIQEACFCLAQIAAIEGDWERTARYDAEMVEAVAGAPAVVAHSQAQLALRLCYLDRVDEAERLLDEARAVPPRGTSGVRVVAAAAEALLLSRRGEHEQAEALARTAVATADAYTDSIWSKARTREDLATVLERAGRIDEAREALEGSLAFWEAKGCLPCASRARERIVALERTNV